MGTENCLFRYGTNRNAKPEVPLAVEIKALLTDRHGVLWVGTTGMGLARYQDGQFTFLKAVDGLGSDNVISLFEDEEGSLWVGTQNGLSQLSDLKFPISSDQEGIGAGSCHSVAPATDNSLLIAANTGLYYLGKGHGMAYKTESPLPNPYIKIAIQDRHGDIYAEDGDKMIYVLSGGRVLARVTNSAWANAFAEDAQSVLVGAGDKLYRILGGKLEPFRYRDEPPAYYWINSLCAARDGAVWVASNNGLFRLQNGAVTHWGGDSQGGNLVLWVCEDVDGTIWCGLANGVARVKDDRISFVTAEYGLPDDRIYSIVPDDFGYLWFDSNWGIFRASRAGMNACADRQAKRLEFNLYDGLESVKFIGRTDQANSGCKTADGRIAFPCPWGVITIDPSRIPTNPIAPPVHITRVAANGEEFSPQKSVAVPPGKGELQIEFTALSFISPQKVRFRYQLDGYDKDWVEAGGRRLAFYANLKPGGYTFRVIAANVDGVWNETGDTLQIELRPHFHQTLSVSLD